MPTVIMRTDRLLVKQQDSDDVTEGGIIIPDQSRVKQSWGRVLDTGPDVEDIEIGDMVAFASFSGVDVELEDEDGKKQEYLVMNQDDVFLLLRGDTENTEQGLNEQTLQIADQSPS